MESLIATGFAIASLALSANAAVAANSPVHRVTTAPIHRAVKTAPATHARAPARVAAGKYQPRSQLNLDIRQFIQSMLAGRMPNYANLMRDVASAPVSHGSNSSSYSSQSYDYSSPADASTNNTQALADQENQEIQQMNDTNALTASMAAAEEQNDEANAATLQTEINAGM